MMKALITLLFLSFSLSSNAQNEDTLRYDTQYYYKTVIDTITSSHNLNRCNCINNQEIHVASISPVRQGIDKEGNLIIWHNYLVLNLNNTSITSYHPKYQTKTTKIESDKKINGIVSDIKNLLKNKNHFLWYSDNNIILKTPNTKMIFIEYCDNNKLKLIYLYEDLSLSEDEVKNENIDLSITRIELSTKIIKFFQEYYLERK